MSEITNLGYLILNVSDLDAWEKFAVGLLGFMVGEKSENRLTLRMDEYTQRIVLDRGADDDIRVVGWEFDNKRDLMNYVEGLREKKIVVTDLTAQLAADRQVEAVFGCEDPNGFRHEFFVGPARAPSSKPFSSPLIKGRGFITGKQGLGHILPIAKDYAVTVDFYNKALGFRVSDYIKDSNTVPGFVLDATFFHTHTGRHHSLATAFIPIPKRLHHFMVEVEDLDDVGRAFDRCVAAGFSMFSGIGRHPNDKMISFYVEGPSGFGVEYGYGGVVIDDANWEVKNYDRISDWGHKPQSAKPLL